MWTCVFVIIHIFHILISDFYLILFKIYRNVVCTYIVFIFEIMEIIIIIIIEIIFNI